MKKEELYVNVAEDLIEDYALDFGNAEVFTQNDCLYCSIEARNNTTISLWVGQIEDKTPAQCRKEIMQAMIDAMGDFDPEEEFDKLWSPDFSRHNGISAFKFVDMLKEDAEYFSDTADRMEKEIKMNKEMTKEQMYVNVAEDLIEDYALDFGNAETYVENDCLYVSIEAINNTTIDFRVKKIKAETPVQCRKEIMQAMIDAMRGFDPEEEFDKVWLPYFSNHSYISPFTCVRMLEEDAEFFSDTADKMEKELA